MAAKESVKSPFENVWKQFLPQGQDNNLRNAFYNIAAAVFFGGAAAAAWSVYMILEPFVKALLWAVLFGSVLHPFKRDASTIIHNWLLGVREAQTPLYINMILLPVTWIDTLSETIGRYVINHAKTVLIVTVLLPSSYIVIHHTPSFLSSLAYSGVYILYYALVTFVSVIGFFRYIIFIGIFAYIVSLLLCWNDQTKPLFRMLSLPVWLLGIIAISTYWTNYPIFVFLIFGGFLTGGIYLEASELRKSEDETVFSKVLAICSGTELIPEQEIELNVTKVEELEEEKKAEELDTTKTLPMIPELPEHQQEPSKFSNSNFYLKTVFTACILVQMWKYNFLMTLLPLSLCYFLIKTTSFKLGNVEAIAKFKEQATESYELSRIWFNERKIVLYPLPIRGVMRLIKKLDKNIVDALLSSTDIFVTLAIMFISILTMTIITLFIAVQIQGEGMHLVSMGSQLVNATIVNNPELKQMLPDGLEDVVSSALDNGYLYGRRYISDAVKNALGETDEAKAEVLEKEVIKLWDHIYQAWFVPQPQGKFSGPAITSEAVSLSFESLVERIKNSLDLVSITDIVKDNIGTLMNVADSIWTILMSNINLALSALTALASLLLGSSLSILNALLNLIVFISSLFYIISISGSVYKPVAFLTDLAPGQMNTLGSAVEDSINGVFLASFKMGAFYGMWTWLLHSIFTTNIIYIPTVLGALFGAVPLVGTYWAAVPGVIELFWGHGSPILALLLFIAQLLPLSCVDTAIYSEIKGGGHPYLTGLAVAGGIFCWGMEGAIFGPLVLCILLVVTKMYASLIKPQPSIGLKSLRRAQSELKLK